MFFIKFLKQIRQFYVLHACLLFSSPAYANGIAHHDLIVSYVTVHLNGSADAVQGVLVTPDGQRYTTTSMGPFSSQKIVLNNPESGDYIVYYQALKDIKAKYCYVVGGIDVHLCDEPSKLIAFMPAESHLQGFTQNRAIKIGDTTLPVALFHIEE